MPVTFTDRPSGHNLMDTIIREQAMTKKIRYDAEELEILQALESGALKAAVDAEQRIQSHQKAAGGQLGAQVCQRAVDQHALSAPLECCFVPPRYNRTPN